ncbi:MAG: hypothetical protein D8H97_44875 [Neisseria sp.]|nr:MAG: hypothetical protein D8H97_44875 [Neisseria sp.]
MKRRRLGWKYTTAAIPAQSGIRTSIFQKWKGIAVMPNLRIPACGRMAAAVFQSFRFAVKTSCTNRRD